MPQGVSPAQLEMLLNGLLQNEEKMPYSFYIEDQVGPLSDQGYKFSSFIYFMSCCTACS